MKKIDRVIAITYPKQRKKEFRSCSNRYLAKSHLVKCLAINKKYMYCNFRGSIFTKVMFENSTIIGCDFWGTRFNNCNFKNTTFSNCVFMSCTFNDCSFNNTVINESVVVNTRMPFQLNASNNDVLKEYPKIKLSEKLSNILEISKLKSDLRKFKLFHISDSKVNTLNIFLLLKAFSEKELADLLQLWLKDPGTTPTTYKMLENKLKKIKTML